MIRKSLYIEELMTELQFELEILSSMVELENQKKIEQEKLIKLEKEKEEERLRLKQKEEEEKVKAEEEERKNRFDTIIVFATTIFVMISTSSDAWSIVNNISQKNFPDTSSKSFAVLVMLLMTIWIIGSFGLINFVVKSLWNVYKKKKQK